MKVLVGIHDPEPGGVHETGAHDMVVLSTERAATGRREAFIGLISSGRATLARVVETPACFRPAGIDPGGHLRRTLALIEHLPVGAVVRPRLAAAARERVHGLPVDLDEWTLDIEGPN